MNNGVNEFSKHLVCSIPRKVFCWLQQMGLDTETGESGALKWSFPRKNLGDFENALIVKFMGEDIDIHWNGHIDSDAKAYGGDARFVDLKTHLEWFVDLEKSVYNALSMLETKLKEIRE